MSPAHYSVWVQLLDRSQQHLKLVLLPLASFIGEGDPPSSSSKCSLLLEESSSHWINVSALDVSVWHETLAIENIGKVQ